MVKKRVAVNNLETLVEKLKTAEDDLTTAVEEPKVGEPTAKAASPKRDELLKLAADKEIPQTVAVIERASGKAIDRYYSEWEKTMEDKAAVFLCDQFLSKFCSVLGGLDAIENPEEMEKELKRDPLLKKDVEGIMAMLTPWIPYIGVLSGGLTVGKHVFNHKATKFGDGFARGPFGGEPPVEERAEEEVENGYDTVN